MSSRKFSWPSLAALLVVLSCGGSTGTTIGETGQTSAGGASTSAGGSGGLTSSTGGNGGTGGHGGGAGSGGGGDGGAAGHGGASGASMGDAGTICPPTVPMSGTPCPIEGFHCIYCAGPTLADGGCWILDVRCMGGKWLVPRDPMPPRP
jgi:hypothetical protein